MNETRAQLQPAVLLFLISVLIFLAFGCGTGGGNDHRSVLVFSKTAGFRHASIEDGKEMFLQLAGEKAFKVDTTEDASAHIWGGMESLWGAESKAVNYAGVKRPPETNRFEVEALVTGMMEPMELELLPDGRPVWITTAYHKVSSQ